MSDATYDLWLSMYKRGVEIVARLKSFLLVEEKLLEAEYFATRLRWLCGNSFQYELNGFLSAARSVTFLLQKEMKEVVGFDSWWDNCQTKMKNDSAMVFFRELRNFSQKQGRISMVGVQKLDGSGQLFWSYRFAGNKENLVPTQLLHRDVVQCCREHLSKLATIILEFADAFPYHSCLCRAVTPEGLNALNLQLSDIEKILGFPNGWVTIAGIPQKELFRILRGHFDGVDFEEIKRITQYKPENNVTIFTSSNLLSDRLAWTLVNRIETRSQ